MDTDQKTLGAAIKKVRLSRGMTQSELAKAAGLLKNGKSLSRIEQGKSEVSASIMSAIAKALDVPSDALSLLGVTTTKTKETTKFVQSLQKLTYAVIDAQRDAQRSDDFESKKKGRNRARNKQPISK